MSLENVERLRAAFDNFLAAERVWGALAHRTRVGYL
jgi:hypothetical protein